MENELIIAGVAASVLAQKYKTPLYVYDEERIEQQLAEYYGNFKSAHFKTKILYASKAFQCKDMINKVEENDFYLDVVSAGEIYGALSAHYPVGKIYFHGNNKTPDELTYGLEVGITHFVVDNLMELEVIGKLALSKKININIMIRLNLGIEAHTHEYIITSYLDSKFGIAIGSQDYERMLEVISSNAYLNLEGFHSHVGSQIFEMNAWEAAIERLVLLVNEFPERLSINIGGGFGIAYTSSDRPLSVKETMQHLVAKTESLLRKHHVKIEELMIEPGRSIVGEAGTTLYTIGYQKQTPNKHYVFVDGGMTDNIRPALYQAEYSCDVANKMDKDKSEKVTIAGKMCESGDVVIKETHLPAVKQGDILAVYATGAYGYSMSSNYNRAQIPAVVFVKNGQARVVVKRQTLADLIRNEVGDDQCV